MNERILEILKVSRNNGLTKEQVYKKLAYTNLPFEDFDEVFEDLKLKRLIYQTGKETYTLNPFKEGDVLITRKGTILVKTEDDTIEITEDQFNCVTGDKVKIRITDFNQKKGTIKEVIKRKGIIAEIKIIKKKKYALHKDTLYLLKEPTNLVEGMIVGIKIEKDRKTKTGIATIDRVFGHKNRPRLDEELILYENNFEFIWNDQIKEELKTIPETINEEDTKNRKDLREELIFTIDGDDTKDIDDAISIKKLENGNYLLGVHIADVSHYVKEESAIDKEAHARGTSVYMNTVVNPMYPVELSNGICSLNPEVDRLAMTCQMEINPNGKLITSDIFESVIRSRKQMTYKNVNKILNEEEIPEGYESYVETLKELYNLSIILEKNRKKRGYQEFDIPEIKVITDEEGIPTEISRRTSGKGEKLIEMFMLAANEAVATYVFQMSVPFIYRVHDKPNEEKLRKVTTVIKNYGESLNITGKMLSSKYITELLESLKNSEKKETYSSMILRSLAKATYESYNIGHFSIGINSNIGEAYTHFTSPIRRYPDTTVHRVLKRIIKGDIENLFHESFKTKMNEIAKHSSMQEQNSDKCERESNKMKTAEYMSKYIGETYTAVISGFTPSGMYIQLANLIEGRVGYNTMDDYYNYDEELEMLIGEKSKKVYKLGDKVEVELVKASKVLREIDFELTKKKKVQNGDTK